MQRRGLGLLAAAVGVLVVAHAWTSVDTAADGGTTPLPAWFGTPALPPARIAGQLRSHGAPVAGTVHLRIHAADATVWRGLEVETDASGHFDFGVLRAGRYGLLAEAPGQMSRTAIVDPRDPTRADGAHVVELDACTQVDAVVRDEHDRPAAGVVLDLDGVTLATSDASGALHACYIASYDHPVLRARGYAASELTRVSRDAASSPRVETLVPSPPIHGHATDEDGRPAANAEVMARIHHVVLADGDTLPIRDGTWVGTQTDASGDFVFDDLAPAPAARYAVAVTTAGTTRPDTRPPMPISPTSPMLVDLRPLAPPGRREGAPIARGRDFLH